MLANQEILEFVCFLFLSVQLNKQTSERIDESCSEQVAKYLKYLNFFDLLEAYFDQGHLCCICIYLVFTTSGGSGHFH